jgi:Rrf2 family iron-sulfur cluster assembly transcriptional regulator
MILTKASKLALYALTEMALRPGELVSASAIAARFGVSENHIAKVLQQLTRADLVESVRGASGGYQLARPAGDVTMAEVVKCIEGPLATDPCDDCPLRTDASDCADHATCSVHNLLSELSSHVYYTLASVTIATLARSKSQKGPERPRKDKS